MSSSHDGRFLRIERLIGSEGLSRLQQSFVCVVGLGAVGSYAVEALARAGVGRLRVVDFDEVRLSNINRQLFALSSTVGQKKCQLATQRIREINPRCTVEALDLFVHTDTIDQVLSDPPHLVIDAIDSFTPKLVLIENLLTRGIPHISAMGAAVRTDPLAIRIGPMEEVHTCPLAAKLRKALRKKHLALTFPCVYSIQPIDRTRPAVEVDHQEKEDSLIRGRPRQALGSLPTLTGIFGLTAANWAIQHLTSSRGRPVAQNRVPG
jgi:tRNA A37 threonylcarbamoyladenosine dehydratase